MSLTTYVNRLVHEKSPYLLQHAHNPVDWRPWGDEAFAQARRDGKFVFLSIGYSTCHWCHVMERESFEDPEVAAVINTVSIPVKVDREERPDVDHVYMAVCQALSGSGGWPLTVFLTPDRTPFFAGTYFPKESRYGRMGLVDLLRQAGALWEQERERVLASAREIMERLARATAGPKAGRLGPEVFSRAVELLREHFDAAKGGFGGPPKFPTPHNLTFLLGRYRRTGEAQTLRMVETTLDAMASGGVCDHLGGGFHRYSTDAAWLLPHFEKMLYDQAGLAQAYLEAFQATGDPRWSEVARSIFRYSLRDLASPEGAFFCAEDADSEGVEGKFYLWTRSEILDALEPDQADLFCRAHGVTEGGNFREEATHRTTGQNVLHLPRPLPLLAADLGTTTGRLEKLLAGSRQALFQRRELRIRPHRDDKVLTSWNGLMISALARGARVLGEPALSRASQRAADFVLSALRPDGRLARRWRDGEVAVNAFAEDCAFLARGLLDLYSATFEAARLSQALEVARELVRRFWDDQEGGLFDSAADAETLILRPKEAYDGATPSANSVALELFARLWLLTGDPSWSDRAHGILHGLASRVSPYPAAFTQFLQGAALLLEPSREVVVVGAPGGADTEDLLSVVRRAWAPETVALFVPTGPERDAAVALAPFTEAMGLVAGRAAAYVCEAFSCRAPVTDAAELERLLASPPRAT